VIELEQEWKENQMFIRQQNESDSGSNNQQVERPICDHCAGITDHERWCITRNAVVSYAFGIVSRASLLTLGDELILHALGVRWSRRGC
jgi:hypothetical protein